MIVPYVALIVIGATWAMTMPLTKIAVEAGYGTFFLLVAGRGLGFLFLTALLLLRRVEFPDMRRNPSLFLWVGVLGTILPGTASVTAFSALPAGIVSIIISLVPIFNLPLALLFGMERPAVLVCLVLAIATGQFTGLPSEFGTAEWAIIGTGLCDSLAYLGYIWLVGRAGSVFAAQVAYTSTGFGVAWSMLLLGERYALTVWLALGLILLGIALVQPRRGDAQPKAA